MNGAQLRDRYSWEVSMGSGARIWSDLEIGGLRDQIILLICGRVLRFPFYLKNLYVIREASFSPQGLKPAFLYGVFRHD